MTDPNKVKFGKFAVHCGADAAHRVGIVKHCCAWCNLQNLFANL